jgi:hypothetical protein
VYDLLSFAAAPDRTLEGCQAEPVMASEAYAATFGQVFAADAPFTCSAGQVSSVAQEHHCQPLEMICSCLGARSQAQAYVSMTW